MLTRRRKSTTVFPWNKCSSTSVPQWGRENQRLLLQGWFFFFPVYHLPFVGNNIGLSSGNTLQLLRWEQHTSLDWSSVASCTTPWALCQETVPIQLCVSAHLETPPGHDGRGHKDKEGGERIGQTAGWTPSPESHTKPLPTGIPVPQEMSVSPCIRYQYVCPCFSTTVFSVQQPF